MSIPLVNNRFGVNINTTKEECEKFCKSVFYHKFATVSISSTTEALGLTAKILNYLYDNKCWDYHIASHVFDTTSSKHEYMLEILSKKSWI